MARLKVNTKVPNLKGQTLTGNKINLSDYLGSPLILSFYRYAACPFCNIRIHDFMKHFEGNYEPSGINAIAVFQSPISKMEKYLDEHQAPFEMVSDPKYRWYKAFGLERSWGGFMKSMTKPVATVRSINKGYMRIDPDGVVNRLPADFLINAGGVIEEAFYAKDIAEHIPFERINKWADQLV